MYKIWKIIKSNKQMIKYESLFLDSMKSSNLSKNKSYKDIVKSGIKVVFKPTTTSESVEQKETNTITDTDSSFFTYSNRLLTNITIHTYRKLMNILIIILIFYLYKGIMNATKGNVFKSG